MRRQPADTKFKANRSSHSIKNEEIRKKYYYRTGTVFMEAYEIKIKVNSESDLYNPLDETQSTLSNNMVNYLMSKIADVYRQDNIILSIRSETAVDEERVKAAFHNLALEKEKQLNNQKRLNSLQQLRLFIIGLIFITAAILLNESINPILTELISIVGSFSIWEAANIWIVQNPKMRWKKRILHRLTSTKIIVPDKN